MSIEASNTRPLGKEFYEKMMRHSSTPASTIYQPLLSPKDPPLFLQSMYSDDASRRLSWSLLFDMAYHTAAAAESGHTVLLVPRGLTLPYATIMEWEDSILARIQIHTIESVRQGLEYLLAMDATSTRGIFWYHPASWHDIQLLQIYMVLYQTHTLSCLLVHGHAALYASPTRQYVLDRCSDQIWSLQGQETSLQCRLIMGADDDEDERRLVVESVGQ